MYDNDDLAYAQNRLVGTLIRYKDEVVSVRDVMYGKNKADPLRIVGVRVLKGDAINKPLPEFDLTPIKLGFVNFDGGVAYISRKAMREDWRQGFRLHQMAVHYQSDDLFIGDISGEKIAKTVENKYPIIEEIFDGVGNVTQAWCKSFATNPAGEILHRGFGKVGNFIGKTKEYLLDADFFWVEEQLKKAI